MARRYKFKKISVALELHYDHIKLAKCFSSKEGPVFHFVKKVFSSREDNEIAREILELFKMHRIGSEKVFLNIPRHFVMTRNLRLPSTKDDEISNMVKMESLRQMPYRDEDMIVGYRIVEKKGDGYSDILMAIAEASSIDCLLDILKKANLTIEKVALSSEALFGWYSMAPERIREDAGSNVALINVDSDYIDIDILEKGKLVFTRAISPRSKQEGLGKDEVDEIGKSIIAYQKEASSNVDKILMTGAASCVNTLVPILKSELDVPVKAVDQIEGIILDKGLEIDLGSASFVELVGLSVKAKEMQINLLPGKRIEENEMRIFRTNLLRTLTLFTCVLIVGFGVIAQKMLDKSRQIRMLDRSIRFMEPQVVKAQRMKEDMKIIKDEVLKKPLAIEVLSEIYRITPGGMTFSLIDYESAESLVLRGNAATLEEIIKFITVLENSPYFENARLRYTTKRSMAGKQSVDFEIVCLLSRIR